MVVTDTTRNQGSASAAASRTAFYLSTNTTFDAADVRLGDRAVPVLNAGAQQLASTTVTVPASTVSGVYYVIARADDLSSVSETSESNNTRASASLTIGPDLVVTSVTAPVDAGAGSPLTVTDTVKNIGTGASPSVEAALFLSTNTTLECRYRADAAHNPRACRRSDQHRIDRRDHSCRDGNGLLLHHRARRC